MSTLIEKALRTLKSDYVTASELSALFQISENARHAQIKRALAQGILVRLKRGLYRRSGYLEKSKSHPFETSGFLYWPSYVSLESALSFHGLIPEAIYTTTCVTTQRPKIIVNPLGRFEYKYLPHNNFFIGVERVEEGTSVYFIANPWKAICDYIYCYKKNWVSIKPLLTSLRIEPDDLPTLTKDVSQKLSDYYDCKRINEFLIGALNEC